MTKIDEPKVSLKALEKSVKDTRSFHNDYRCAKQNYDEILENLEPIIRYGNMSIEEIECFVHHYENPYIEKCRKYANPEQREQIEQLQKEMQQRLSILLIMCHDGLKQTFMKKLGVYGYTQKGNLFAHFINHEQSVFFHYIKETSKQWLMEPYEVDPQGRITLSKKHPVYNMHIESSGRFHLYRRTSIFHMTHMYYHINDIRMILQDNRIVLQSFTLEEEQTKMVLSFTNRILLKTEDGNEKQFTFDPYVYTDLDDVSKLIENCIEEWKS